MTLRTPMTAPCSSPNTKVEAQHVIVIEKVDFSFTASQTITLAKYIDTRGWASGVYMGRVHAINLTTSSSANLLLQGASYAPDEPNTMFVTSSSQSLSLGTSAPSLVLASIAVPIGMFLRSQLQYNHVTAGTSTLTIAVELIGRDG